MKQAREVENIDNHPVGTQSRLGGMSLQFYKNAFLILLLVALGFRLFTVGASYSNSCKEQLYKLFFNTVKEKGARSWLQQSPYLGGYDERCYRIFVKTLGEEGIGGIRSLIREYPYSDTLNMGPLPFRILYPVAGLLNCKIIGNYGLQNLALISFLSGIGIIIMGFLLLKNWFTMPVAMLTSLLLITSPLATALSRRALADSFFTFIVITSIFFYHKCWCHRKMINSIMLGLTVLAGLLTKESMMFLYIPFAIAGIYYSRRSEQGIRHSSFVIRHLIIPLVIAPLLYFFSVIWIAGGFQTFWKTYIAYSIMQSKIPYAIQYQQGPWFRYIIDFLLLSPLTYLLSIVGITSCLSDKSSENGRHPALAEHQGRNLSIIYVLSGLIVFSCLPIMNLRFVLFIDVPLRALSVLGILVIADLPTSCQAGKIPKPNYRYIIIALLSILVLSSDIYQFFRIFVNSKICDPVTQALIKANGF